MSGSLKLGCDARPRIHIWATREGYAFSIGPTGLRSAPSDQFGRAAVAGYEAIGAKPCVIIVECEA